MVVDALGVVPGILAVRVVWGLVYLMWASMAGIAWCWGARSGAANMVALLAFVAILQWLRAVVINTIAMLGAIAR